MLFAFFSVEKVLSAEELGAGEREMSTRRRGSIQGSGSGVDAPLGNPNLCCMHVLPAPGAFGGTNKNRRNERGHVGFDLKIFAQGRRRNVSVSLNLCAYIRKRVRESIRIFENIF